MARFSGAIRGDLTRTETHLPCAVNLDDMIGLVSLSWIDAEQATLTMDSDGVRPAR